MQDDYQCLQNFKNPKMLGKKRMNEINIEISGKSKLNISIVFIKR
jgi:hypothetical protein